MCPHLWVQFKKIKKKRYKRKDIPENQNGKTKWEKAACKIAAWTISQQEKKIPNLAFKPKAWLAGN